MLNLLTVVVSGSIVLGMEEPNLYSNVWRSIHRTDVLMESAYASLGKSAANLVRHEQALKKWKQDVDIERLKQKLIEEELKREQVIRSEASQRKEIMMKVEKAQRKRKRGEIE